MSETLKTGGEKSVENNTNHFGVLTETNGEFDPDKAKNFTGQNTPTTTPVADTIRQSDGKGWKITTAITSIVAICGIGFGVYGMAQSMQKDNQISDLKNQIEEGKEKETAVDTSEDETTADGGTATDTIKAGSGPYIENNYFYVPKWGAKFKLSENLTNYGYAVDQNSQSDSYGDYVVGLTAIMKKDYISNPQVQYYHDIFSCSVVTIRNGNRNASLNGMKYSSIAFEDKTLIIHDTWREWDCSNNEPYTNYYVSTDEVATELVKMLSNPEKI